jgi:hypothetical protein
MGWRHGVVNAVPAGMWGTFWDSAHDNGQVRTPTPQQLARLHADRDAFVASWLKDHPEVDLREPLTSAFSAGVTAAVAL